MFSDGAYFVNPGDEQLAGVFNINDGEEGLDKFNEGEFDLVIMDIMMPVMNGDEATRLLKMDPKTKDIPVIALTASSKHEKEENF